MPKRTDIKSILIIGAGPIVIGQACEFDYSGAQACKALREEGFRVILINSNPATIMTDPGMADATYIEPLTVQALTEIIETSLMDKNEFSKDRWLDDCLILMACHKAVRANLRMNVMEMESLLRDLEKCENPLHCPHGRPIRVTLSKNDLEKLFKRIV